jgi:hypothetical protein
MSGGQTLSAGTVFPGFARNIGGRDLPCFAYHGVFSALAQCTVNNYTASVSVVGLWEVIFICLRVENRPFGGSGRPGGPGRPFLWVGGFAPHLLEGSPGPRGRTDPQSDRFPILKEFLNSIAIQSAATLRGGGLGGTPETK